MMVRGHRALGGGEGSPIAHGRQGGHRIDRIVNSHESNSIHVWSVAALL